MKCLLPEIFDPLYGRRFEITDIREPEYIKEAQKKNEKKKTVEWIRLSEHS